MSRNHGWSIIAGDDEKHPYTLSLTDAAGAPVLDISSSDFPLQPRRSRSPAAPSPVRWLEVTLSVEKGVRSRPRSPALRWPVGGGIPFPQGALWFPDDARLLDAEGDERLAQVAVLSQWPDGSVRWLLVETAAHLPADLEGGFMLEYGTGVRRAAAPAELRTMDIPEWQQHLAADGESFLPQSQALQTIERDGPVHRIEASGGTYAGQSGDSNFGFHARVHTYPGLQLARIEHMFHVKHGVPMASLTSLRLLLPSDGGTGSERVEVFEWDRDSRPQSWMPLGRDGTTVFLRHMRENWPKAITQLNGSVEIELFPEVSSDRYGGSSQQPEFLHYPFRGGQYLLRRGLRKTHEILIAGLQHAGGSLDPEAVAYWLDNPPVLRAGPELACSAGAAGHLVASAQSTLPEYEKRTAEGHANVQKRRLSLGEFGFMNFGDWFGERKHNWANSEYDLAHALWLHWLRSGDHTYFARAWEAASHTSDVDLVHADPSADNIGRMWGHCVGHTGGYFPPGTFGMEPIWLDGFWDNGHTWCEGLLHLYLATGDERFRDAGLMVAGQIARYATANFSMASERSAGWPLVALTAAYEFSNDPYYLNAAKIFARAALQRQDPERGGWFWRIGECTHVPQHVGGKPFMAGILATGLSRLHRQLRDATPDDREFRSRVGESLIRGCDWLLNETWVEEANGFVYAQCPDADRRPCRTAPWMACEALAYVTHISGEKRYILTAERAIRRMFDFPAAGSGNALAVQCRFTPHFLAALAAG